jgi:CheY-like chemotaxis protein
MSHELRSPLNAILGFAQLMETDIPPPSSLQLEGISQILQAGWHLLTLINEILDLAKIEAQQISLLLEPVSLNEIMVECQRISENQAQKHGIKMHFPVVTLPIYILADRTRVKQVVINLLSNSIKYNRKFGKVEVEYKAVKSDRVRISFKDNGFGLSEDQIAQLYQPFNRLSQEAGSEEGTGIGLVVAKRLVELMGGVIGVESKVGVGSTFWFELSTVTKGIKEKINKKENLLNIEVTPKVINPKTLLYVEDNPANMKLVEGIIRRLPNLKLLTATNGINGVEIAQKMLPDLILMDINLPGISGLEALEMLQSETITSNIPVIAISANAMLTDTEKGINAGFFKYITKPIKVNELIEAINSALMLLK